MGIKKQLIYIRMTNRYGQLYTLFFSEFDGSYFITVKNRSQKAVDRIVSLCLEK